MTDPLEPVHPDDPYYDEEPDDLQWWDAEVDYQRETR